MATEVEEDQRTHGREISTRKCGQQEEDGGDSTRQSLIDKWSVTCDPLGATRNKSSKGYDTRSKLSVQVNMVP